LANSVQAPSISSFGAAKQATHGHLPFLKWPGGKNWLAPYLEPIIRGSTGRYFEPFLGGGATFFATIGDCSQELIETYRSVRDDPVSVLAWLRAWPNREAVFYTLRGSDFSSAAKRAARFIYLNRTCWNGIHRVNRAGRFNTPFGHYYNRKVIDESLLIAASQTLRRAILCCGDFEATLKDVARGDFVYLDPPYVEPNCTGKFRRYNSRKFTWEDQERLASIAAALAAGGARVVVSNSSRQEVVNLYRGFEVHTMARPRLIAADGAKRRVDYEVILTSWSCSG